MCTVVLLWLADDKIIAEVRELLLAYNAHAVFFWMFRLLRSMLPSAQVLQVRSTELNLGPQ